MPKIWGFNIRKCDTDEVFKNKKTPEIPKENVCEFARDRGWKDIALFVQSSDTVSVKFSVFKNFTSATVFNL